MSRVTHFKTSTEHGFTLIELLVVIAIIGLLSSILLINLANARSKARDAVRKRDLVTMQKALELYYNTNGAYPIAVVWGSVNGGCGGSPSGTTGAGGYIPNLAPTYISQLPIDPSNSPVTCTGYMYFSSDGTGYVILDHVTPESFPAAGQPFYDSLRPGYAWKVCVTATYCAD